MAARSAVGSEEWGSKKILVVGAGGIGCELLKNLVLAGFADIDVVDLDTIDVSNLNRQFLFQKRHVGGSKAKVAAESVLRFAPSAKVTPHHGSIMGEEFSVERFASYAVVLNALDNRAARNHVNRMCLAAEVPLVESGSAGYLGQTAVIRKGVSECYECVPKAPAKTFPGCTIRNTPAEPIHCIVWAKHLFAQLFGQADIDEDVAPDPDAVDPDADPNDAADKPTNGANGDGPKDSAPTNGDAAKEATNGAVTDDGPKEKKLSTRAWAEDIKYDPSQLFGKLFHDDVRMLLSMSNLWKKRTPPQPLVKADLPTELPTASAAAAPDAGLKDKKVWPPAEAAAVFCRSVGQLSAALAASSSPLVWDKDDAAALDFVTAAANLRAFAFHIPLKSRFEVKSMAGNIIPAIATTNAIVAALIVVEAVKIVRGYADDCRSTFIVRQPNPRGKILVDMELAPPRKDCYVCAAKPSVTVALNPGTMTAKGFEEKLLKGGLAFVAPDVNVEGSGALIVSSEPGELAALAEKSLTELSVVDGSRLLVDDFMQKFELRLTVKADEKLQGDDFRLLSDVSQLKCLSDDTPAQAEALEEAEAGAAEEEDEVMEVVGEVKAAAKRPAAVPASDEEGPAAKAPKVA